MTTRKGVVALVAAATMATMGLTACAGDSQSPEGEDVGGSQSPESEDVGGSQSPESEVAGDITFLTNRTDLEADGTWAAYVAEFQKEYPDVDVKVEAITNYADDVRTRMSTPNGYGDVLLIPEVPADQFPEFFEPLGTVDELSNDYRWVSEKSFDGNVYGIALGGTANGVLYNKAVFEEAGITDLPTSNEEFIAALKLVAEKTDATPYYTNYKDGWPLGGQWTANLGAITGSADAQIEMAHNETPWIEGTDIYAIDSLLYDIVAAGLSEADPLTTNWEQSKSDFANGKIATMVLGSWAISQFQAAATDAGANPDDVGFMAFPSNIDGKQFATAGGDYKLAINKNSSNMAAARAWLDFLIEDSGFTEAQGMISALKSAELPSNLSSLSDNGVELIEANPAPAGEEGLLSSTADASQVDIWGNIYRQKLVDTARGQAGGDKESLFAELNSAWGAAVKDLAG